MNETTKQELNGSKSRYEKGLELYRAGKVSINPNGLFKVSGYYDVDTERMTCTCPDYKTRKQTCEHIYASMLFVKNRGKQTIEHLNSHSSTNGTSENKAENSSNSENKAQSKDFSRQSTITRLAVINSAIEVLKTHRKAIEIQEVIALASQLETWALSK